MDTLNLAYFFALSIAIMRGDLESYTWWSRVASRYYLLFGEPLVLEDTLGNWI